MKEFVQKNLKELQIQSKAISMHIGAAEVIQVTTLATHMMIFFKFCRYENNLA